MQLCKLAIPAWADVELGDFTLEAIKGGASGGVFKWLVIRVELKGSYLEKP